MVRTIQRQGCVQRALTEPSLESDCYSECELAGSEFPRPWLEASLKCMPVRYYASRGLRVWSAWFTMRSIVEVYVRLHTTFGNGRSGSGKVSPPSTLAAAGPSAVAQSFSRFYGS